MECPAQTALELKSEPPKTPFPSPLPCASCFLPASHLQYVGPHIHTRTCAFLCVTMEAGVVCVYTCAFQCVCVDVEAREQPQVLPEALPTLILERGFVSNKVYLL